MPPGLHQQLSSHFDPETDAPPAGQLLVESHRDLFIAALVLPLLLALLVHWVPAVFRARRRDSSSSRRQPSRKASSRKQQQQPSSCHLSPDSDSHRHRHSRTRPAPAQPQQELWPQQPQWHASPPPLQTYHQLQQHWDPYGSMSDPPQQQRRQFNTPQTDRPFRRTQAHTPQARPASPQSERPFRVTQAQRVYSTPDSDGSPSRPVPTSVGRPQSQSQTPLSQTAGRPFRASKSAAAATTPRSSSQAATGRASPRAPTTDAPFRFRDSTELERQQQQHLPADGTPGYGSVPAANGGGAPMLFTSPSQQQQQQSSPRWQQQRVQMQQQRQSPVWGLPQRSPAAAAAAAAAHGSDADDYAFSSSDEEGEDKHTPAQKHSKAAGWDPSLLRRCEQQEALISSVEGLQQSREYRKHIKQARQRHMTLELKERHKLNVYKALRNVDPESFRQLFSRKDVLEYDELPLSRTLALCECLLSVCLTFALLGAPIWLPAWQPYQTPFALLWLLQQLWVVVVCGCTSLAARVLSVYSTQGLYSMRPSCWRLLVAVAVDALLVVGPPVLGVLALLACRLLTEQRQSCGERLLRLQPMREVVRPMHFSPYSPAGYKTAGGIETDDGEDD